MAWRQNNTGDSDAFLLPLLFAAAAILAAHPATAQIPEPEAMRIRLVGANPAAAGAMPQEIGAHGLYISTSAEDIAAGRVTETCYRNVYPGIDLAIYDDGYKTEYAFFLRPGADPDLIRIQIEGPQNFSLTQAGGIRYLMPDAEMLVSPPCAIAACDGRQAATPASIRMRPGRLLMFDLPEIQAKLRDAFNGSRFNIVPAGGQPGGPAYTFYMAKHEITHNQFLVFLNDAETHPNDELGANMFFDRNGNVWINQQRKSRRDEMFRVVQSFISYDPSKPAGRRYEHRKSPDGSTPMAETPVFGVSWYGAVKYCNWLTIRSGRGASERCYTEGTCGTNWAPVTATNWAAGVFADSERQLWLSKKGFRLPMANVRAPDMATNAFNEFYKAAAWHMYTNRVYGFGRDVFSGTDACCLNTIGLQRPSPLPVGFFNGETFLDPRRIRTSPSENFFQISDLTGNADEILNDFALAGDANSRIAAGGSWSDPVKPLTFCRSVKPWDTDSSTGFRPLTTFMPEEKLEIHVLFSFFARFGAPQTGVVAAAELPMPQPEAAEQVPAGEAGSVLKAEPSAREPQAISYTTEPEWPPPPAPPPPHEPGGHEKPPGPPPPPPVATNTLVVESLNPDAGVAIALSPADVNGLGSGVTPGITRIYLRGTVVRLTAPAFAPNGNVFRRWLRNGAPYSTSTSVNITLASDTVMTAVYEQAPVTRVLTVRSSNPSTGVPITVSPSDLNTNGNGVTRFTRFYQDGTSVTLTAPLTAGSNRFQKWQMDGVDYSWVRTVTVLMDADHTLMAIYVYVPTPIPDPDVSSGGL